MLLFILTHHLSIRNQNRISIHLMLLFIAGGWCYVDLKAWFQYISCYCLSVHKVLFLSCHHTHFNTSHVTVYHKIQLHLSIWFRNFNTSHVTVYQLHQTLHESLYFISIHLMLLFIDYRKGEYLGLGIISIHLMLLFINRPLNTLLNSLENFNTSHVTVYPLHRKSFR